MTSNRSGPGEQPPPDGTSGQVERTESFSVPGMDCPSCVGKIENSLDGADGVIEHSASPTTEKVKITYNTQKTSGENLVNAIERAGYHVQETETESSSQADPSDASDARENVWKSPRAIKTWTCGAFLGIAVPLEFLVSSQNVLVGTLLGREFLLSDILFLLAIAVGGQVILRNGYYSLRNLSLDIDFLMSAAIIGSVAASVIAADQRLYFEAATLAFLFNTAELLERYSMDRARNSLRELMDLSPDEATVRREGEEKRIPTEDVELGDTVLVQPGEKIPMDGEVVEGESAVNQAPITGESVPVDKKIGDEVFAGTINESGYLEVEVTKKAEDNTLSRIIRMVEDAESNKTEREQFVERFSKYYTPIMVSVAVLVGSIPSVVFGQPWLPWFVNGITILVLACPCAFVISTPVSVVSGITSAAKNGVLIKGGNHLEAMGSVDAIAFDKTGTLTRGELAVTDVIPLNGYTEDDVLDCAHGVETRSEHPIAEAIVDYSGDSPDRQISGFENLTGKGVHARLDDVPHYAGKPDLFTQLGFDIEHVHGVPGDGEVETEFRQMCEREGCLNLVEDTIPRLQSEGKTVVIVGTEDEIEGVIAVADEVRSDARRVIEMLRELGVGHLVMLTGDNEGTARAIAEDIALDEYHAELLPEDKVEAVERLEKDYGSVAMVGDGVNDAPALATATVGVAMGAAGTDTALETADIALMSDDLSNLPYLYSLSHRANTVIRENIWASLGAKLLLALGVPLGYVGVVHAVLIGDAGMTLGVTGNAVRLAKIVPEKLLASNESGE